ncbi:MAG: transporter substrate-binding domain-containing protein [Spirochaetes bacterium]|nr:transporter substrate-binding domain-containing protein [Spirochaetota bacterium]
MYKSFVLFILLFSQSYILNSQNKIIIAATHYPPYEIENPTDNLPGFDVEVVLKVFELLHIPAEVQFFPWQRAVTMTTLGKTTALLSCGDTKERREVLYLSDQISQSTLIFLTRSDYSGPVLKNISDLKGLPFAIGCLRGYAICEELNVNMVPFELSDNDEQGIIKLAYSRIDILLNNLETTQYILLKKNIPQQLKWYVLERQPYTFHLGFSKLWPNSKTLLIKFNQELATIKANGIYQAIHDKYKLK